MKIEPIILEGNFVRLEPLSLNHLDQLCEVGLDNELWRIIPTQITNKIEMKQYIEIALAEQNQGLALPFATVEKESNKAIGSTRFGNISVKDKRAEIGWTWIAKNWQRTFVNTEAKLLMLTHAFETWKFNRIEFKTDFLNEQSRNAILRLGATQEGIFRNHVVCDNGRIRDSVYFSIIDSEWQKVKENLEIKLVGK
ncbi:MAG: GNAT family N-acetyltransferase [Pyrinomonadaceae bacterium]|jgi:RimJ/RimL family protein N-acetyltransferase|nr:GNAT family N-acetyltransferase [Pyrinomonadaceae bacterium]